MAIRKSAGLLEIEKKLLEVEARIAADRFIIIYSVGSVKKKKKLTSCRFNIFATN
jgi:hypothetical protein